MASFSQCKSTKKLQETTPIELGKVYFHKWIAGVKGGGAGTNIFIPLSSTSQNSIVLDSVYFRGKVAKLEIKQQEQIVYIGRFISEFNQKEDIMMSNEPNAEYGNKMPKLAKKIPFELKDDQCVVSYKDGGTTKYFKIDNIIEKQTTPMMSAPPNNKN